MNEPEPDQILHAIRAQLAGLDIIADALRQAGYSANTANLGANLIIARLASHEPPILLCHPDEIRDWPTRDPA